MAAREAGVERFFYASSACVYNADKQRDPNVTALKEEDAYPAMPEDGYGWEKLFSERMCRHFREDFGMHTRVARFHNVYGPHGTWEGGREKAPAAVCRKVIAAKLSGRHEIEIWGDGDQTRSFMYITDCLLGIQKIMGSSSSIRSTWDRRSWSPSTSSSTSPRTSPASSSRGATSSTRPAASPGATRTTRASWPSSAGSPPRASATGWS